MFAIYDTYKKSYKYPFNGMSQKLNELGLVVLERQSKSLGSGEFTGVVVINKGKPGRLHCLFEKVKLSPAACSHYIYENGGEKCEASFVINDMQKQQILDLVYLHDADLLSKHKPDEHYKEGECCVAVPIDTLQDKTTFAVKIKITSKTKGVAASGKTLAEKAILINKLWDTKELVNVEAYISGYFFNAKTNEIKLCMTCIDIAKVSVFDRKRTLPKGETSSDTKTPKKSRKQIKPDLIE